MKDLTAFLSNSLIGWLVIQVCLMLIFLWYLRTYKQPFLSDNQLPKTAVILCLRGADPFLPNCVRSLLNQNYPEYDLKLIIDSPEDPAFKIAKEVIAETKATNFQISTLRTVRHNCSLKCSSLVQAVSDLDDSYQVIALVDADTIVHKNWLRELVSPLTDEKVGITTGNRWYVPTGKYWGSLIRYAGNVSTVVQMFLFQVPWGGSLAIKKQLLQQTEILEKWGEAFGDDMLLHKVIKKHGWKIKFVPSLLMVNREESNLSTLFPSLQRLILCSRLYHPNWLALVSDAVSSILFPTLTLFLALGLFLATEWNTAFSLFKSYSIYTIGLLLLMLVMELGVQEIIRSQGQPIPEISLTNILKMFIAIPLTQWVYGLAMLSSLGMSTVTWRGLTYKIQSPWHIRLVEYHPYQWLDQPIDPKISL
ncbi:glycosyltransferase family 2 protein [Sphaerospermopsis sp. FACHB-1094]|jgi:cellulose synthase/poly-beta-1,6-N-acetylglucosamine synthase-like glycosyltransferase|uniref:Family 2 glycosyl transferase n=1 Tax=Sphaerospermopsis reniformis TaxID=531300 RepID=A0A479ZTT0_9CYAN|nr:MULTISPECIES: glycosyltransferase family 2 protein [Sphaerospermopsis]MBD2131384.1 glycosyltransferase family 2 protein [Sphaerospermopsis sp. FACHB-1094]GCL35897.1 family 2 glycosyl transferase [Sphaerospermopsis reniformis]